MEKPKLYARVVMASVPEREPEPEPKESDSYLLGQLQQAVRNYLITGSAEHRAVLARLTDPCDHMDAYRRAARLTEDEAALCECGERLFAGRLK
jgi:hypothetical protein